MGRFDSTCWSTVMGAAAGDLDDREAFARQYAPVIRAFFSARWKLPFENDDVTEGVQEVFLQCFKSEGALTRVDPERPAGFRAYLYGIAKKVALMIERKAARRDRDRAETAFDPDEVVRSELTLSRAFDRGWAKMLARQARLLLAERAHERSSRGMRLRCLELRYSGGLPPREIAGQLELRINQVYEMLKVARRDYRAALFEVISAYHPHASQAELEKRCRELVTLL